MRLVALQQWMLSAIRSRSAADEHLVGTSTLSASARLQIYANAYALRLRDTMRQEFPVLRHICGDELFDHFTTDYLAAHPPASWTLSDLGADFPSWLAATAPTPREAWMSLLIDLALLERTFNELYDASPTALPRLLRLSHPLADYFTAVRGGRETSLPTAEETTVVLSRRGWEVVVTQRHSQHFLDES